MTFAHVVNFERKLRWFNVYSLSERVDDKVIRTFYWGYPHYFLTFTLPKIIAVIFCVLFYPIKKLTRSGNPVITVKFYGDYSFKLFSIDWTKQWNECRSDMHKTLELRDREKRQRK